jgi:16S rRNA G966 N2-methylase RsmD
VLAALLPVLAAQARVYCESGDKLAPPAGWETFRQSRAGQVHYQLLKRSHS